jgi:ketosteroid isomerase-like protein
MTHPAVALEQYLDATNSHDFDQVARILVPEPVYFFGDATCVGQAAVRSYFERTWALIPDERYGAEDVEWVVDGHDAAVAIYTYRWSGTVQGAPASGAGRATNAFVKTPEGWRLAHEHLSTLAVPDSDDASRVGGV